MSTLPDNGGYVAAAYLVFVVLLLVYLGILGLRLGRMERTLAELDELAAAQDAERGADRERTPA